LGAAADFIIENKNMYEVAEWVMNNTSFDRLYFYGNNLPIHVSYSLNPKGEYVEMKQSLSGRRIPRVVKKLKSL
jgi:hypothetical protein